jgi:valyl-tRNA synthetase
MDIPKRYRPATREPKMIERWQKSGVYEFDRASGAPVYSIDTPPPTVSGNLHLGHVYSYSHADFVARFRRMNGYNVFYPMGFDDNGLPTERLIESRLGKKAAEIGREAFIHTCLAVSEEAEEVYRELWMRLGLSIDWRYSYRTIDDDSRRIAQVSFLDLLEKGFAYRQKAPAIWCPECRTSLAQADLDDLDRWATFHTLAFSLAGDGTLPIATTRPELLPACVAVFVHPQDGRFTHLIGKEAQVPLFGQTVPILADPEADPQKGTGAVMCCTFGDRADIAWWHTFQLPLVEAIANDGRMTAAAGIYEGKTTIQAREEIVADLADAGLLLGSESQEQSVRVHERCDTPVEYVITGQWFIRILEHKDKFLGAGEQVKWHPSHMANRYRQWVENLNWDWGISRQRYFGVSFPVWYCENCDEIITATLDTLPIDPREEEPGILCPSCGNGSFIPDPDVMDTWATSSMTPQIVGRWQKDEDLYKKVFPFSCRPQAQEIIRTWAFYTIVKSKLHFQTLPWSDALISGWGLAPEGAAKLSKSRGGGLVAPMDMIERYSADAVRYWAASTALGKDAIIDEQRIQAGTKFVTKLWNVARFSMRFLVDPRQAGIESGMARLIPDATAEEMRPGIILSPADSWILARTAQLIDRSTALWEDYDYASARSEVEIFFWRDLADNYLEMIKKRLYEDSQPQGARYALYHALLTVTKLLAPIMPFVTEGIYQGLFAEFEGTESVHKSSWPKVEANWRNENALTFGEVLLEIATAVRRFKSDNNLSLGTELDRLELATTDSKLAESLEAARLDIAGLTRAANILVGPILSGQGTVLHLNNNQGTRIAVAN